MEGDPTFFLKILVESWVNGVVVDIDPFEQSQVNGESFMEACKRGEFLFKVDRGVATIECSAIFLKATDIAIASPFPVAKS